MASSEIVQSPSHVDRFPAWLAREGRRSAMIFAFVVLTFLIATIRGDSILPHIVEYTGRIVRFLPLLGSILVAVVGSCALVQGRHGSPVSIAVASLGGMSNTLARGFCASVVLALFMAAFLYNKMMIPIVAPFQWDETFSHWDANLLGGNQAWQIIQPVVGMPWVTRLLDIVYTLWMLLVFLFWVGLLVSPRVPERIRLRYWRATVISWILIGLVIATLFSSAGPCYFAEMVPGAPSPYADLMRYLDEVASIYPLSSSLTQDFLWEVYTGRVDLPGGISAMPSMHNAQAALFVAVAYSIDRRFGHAMLAFGVLLFFGSIHLGWHYAVDGIVGIAAALAIWWGCGKLGLANDDTFLSERVLAQH
ncbi:MULTISPECIES: phosphatase PAP2 family protein [unclassified Mesorhizobium]|nr:MULTISPECIES: phosphatase PAP2 family protein [unclassified Mesorhizobium]WJI45555.1 phosphatase PAP2 family protein [Mesorhizobium sp. C120A]WJI81892.1 phosphatase PAP2 family protein [Mesorhizobium sp. C374B]WJI88411.1 phosphatase PAP2 family protein [Mesorhizobium sp. C372A]